MFSISFLIIALLYSAYLVFSISAVKRQVAAIFSTDKEKLTSPELIAMREVAEEEDLFGEFVKTKGAIILYFHGAGTYSSTGSIFQWAIGGIGIYYVFQGRWMALVFAAVVFLAVGWASSRFNFQAMMKEFSKETALELQSITDELLKAKGIKDYTGVSSLSAWDVYQSLNDALGKRDKRVGELYDELRNKKENISDESITA